MYLGLFENLGPEVRREERSSVGDNVTRKTVKTEDLTDEVLGKVGGGVGGVARDEVGSFGETIDEDENSIEATAGRKRTNVIHRD